MKKIFKIGSLVIQLELDKHGFWVTKSEGNKVKFWVWLAKSNACGINALHFIFLFVSISVIKIND